jgi:hypothetical protein
MCSATATQMTYPHARADGYDYFEVGAGTNPSGAFGFYCNLASCL